MEAVLDEKDIRTLENWNESLDSEIRVILRRGDDARSQAFQAFADALRKAAPRLGIDLQPIPSDAPPGFVAGRRFYHAIPRGAELEPFLEFISPGEDPASRLADFMKNRLQAVGHVPDLKIFITQECPFCPGAVRQAATLAGALPECTATIIDSELFPEWASEYNVKAVPTVILDDEHRLTGNIRISEMADILETADVSRFTTDSLKRMLKEGQAGTLAEKMLEKKILFPAFLPLLTHPEWNVRLGAMAALEEISESDPALARTALDVLWKDYELQDSSVRGDIVYLVGEMGGEEWIAPLESLLSGSPGEEMAEVIEEALSKLRT